MWATLDWQWWLIGHVAAAVDVDAGVLEAEAVELGIEPMASRAWLPWATRPSSQQHQHAVVGRGRCRSARAPLSRRTPRRSNSSSRAAATSASLLGSTCWRLTIRRDLATRTSGTCGRTPRRSRPSR